MRVIIFPLLFIVINANADYWSMRQQFIQNEESLAIGSRISLNANEQKVNKHLMQAKWRELDFAFKNPGKFPPARHFFDAKPDIEQSTVFNIIRRMPKGGALHLHDTALSSSDYVLYNITYRDHLLVCETAKGFQMVFADPPPQDECWKPMKELRKHALNEDTFNAWLQTKFSLVINKPEATYTDINVVWKKFMNILDTVIPLISYKPVFLDYFYNGLEEYYRDNVDFIEIRGRLPVLYELNGLVYNPMQVLEMLKNVADEFRKNQPGFSGVKYIYTQMRAVDNQTMDDTIQMFQIMHQMHPDFLVGFDIAGQEDLGKPLSNFVEQLQEVSENVKFYFHAGETDWNGMPSDLDLIDAILLNTTRIGHGYALTKHPAVMKEVKMRNIGIEVNPISNQVLTLVKDLRNHPASVFFAEDYPVVISADDASFWGVTGLSYDFYEAFMGIASRSADLRMLKQLILNSFEYSSLSPDEKQIALEVWEVKWDNFIDDIIVNKINIE